MSLKVSVLLLFVSFLLTSLDPILAESRNCPNDLYYKRDFREERRILSRNDEFNRFISKSNGNYRGERNELERNTDQNRANIRYDERVERQENLRRINHENEGILQRISERKNIENERFDSPYMNRQLDNRRREIVRVSFDSLQRNRELSREINPVEIRNNGQDLNYPYEVTRYAVDRTDNDLRRLTREEYRKDVKILNRENLEFNNSNLRFDRLTNTENSADTFNELSRISSKDLDNRIFYDVRERIDESTHRGMRNNHREETRQNSRRETLERSEGQQIMNMYRENNRLGFNLKRDVPYDRRMEDSRISRTTDSRINYNVATRQENREHRYENLNNSDRRITKLEKFLTILSEPVDFEKRLTFLMQSSFIAILVFKIIGDCDKTQKHWATIAGGLMNRIGF